MVGSKPPVRMKSIEFFLSKAVTSKDYDEALSHVADAFEYYSQFPELRQRYLTKKAQEPGKPPDPPQPGGGPSLQPGQTPANDTALKPPAPPGSPRPTSGAPTTPASPGVDDQQLLSQIRTGSRDEMLRYLLYGSLAGAGLGALYSAASRTKKRPFRLSDVLSGLLLGGAAGGALRSGLNYLNTGYVLPGYNLLGGENQPQNRKDLEAIYEYVTGNKPPAPPAPPATPPTPGSPSGPAAGSGAGGGPTAPGAGGQGATTPNRPLLVSSLRRPTVDSRTVKAFAPTVAEIFASEFFPTKAAEDFTISLIGSPDPVDVAARFLRGSMIGDSLSLNLSPFPAHHQDTRASVLAQSMRDAFDEFSAYQNSLRSLDNQIAALQARYNAATDQEAKKQISEQMKLLTEAREELSTGYTYLKSDYRLQETRGAYSSAGIYFIPLADPLEATKKRSKDFADIAQGKFTFSGAEDFDAAVLNPQRRTYRDLALDYATSVATEHASFYDKNRDSDIAGIYNPHSLTADHFKGKDRSEKVAYLSKKLLGTADAYLKSLVLEIAGNQPPEEQDKIFKRLRSMLHHRPSQFFQEYAGRSLSAKNAYRLHDAYTQLYKYVLPVENEDLFWTHYKLLNGLEADAKKDQNIIQQFQARANSEAYGPDTSIQDLGKILRDYASGNLPEDSLKQDAYKLIMERARATFRGAAYEFTASQGIPGSGNVFGLFRELGDALASAEGGGALDLLSASAGQTLLIAGPVELAIGPTIYPFVRKAVIRRALRHLPEWIEAIEQGNEDVISKLPRSLVDRIQVLLQRAQNPTGPHDEYSRFLLSLLKTNHPELENLFSVPGRHFSYLGHRWVGRPVRWGVNKIMALPYIRSFVTPSAQPPTFGIQLSEDLLQKAFDQYIRDYGGKSPEARQQAIRAFQNLGLYDSQGRPRAGWFNQFLKNVPGPDGSGLSYRWSLNTGNRIARNDLMLLHDLEKNIESKISALTTNRPKPNTPLTPDALKQLDSLNQQLRNVRATRARLVVQTAVTDPDLRSDFVANVKEIQRLLSQQSSGANLDQHRQALAYYLEHLVPGNDRKAMDLRLRLADDIVDTYTRAEANLEGQLKQFGFNANQIQELRPEIDDAISKQIFISLSEPEYRGRAELVINRDSDFAKKYGLRKRITVFGGPITFPDGGQFASHPTLTSLLTQKHKHVIPQITEPESLLKYRNLTGHLAGFLNMDNQHLDDLIRVLGADTVYDTLKFSLARQGIDLDKAVVFDRNTKEFRFTDDFLDYARRHLAQPSEAFVSQTSAQSGKGTNVQGGKGKVVKAQPIDIQDIVKGFFEQHPTSGVAPGAKVDVAKAFSEAVQDTKTSLGALAGYVRLQRGGIEAPFFQDLIQGYTRAAPGRLNRLGVRAALLVTTPKFSVPAMFGIVTASEARQNLLRKQQLAAEKQLNISPVGGAFGNLTGDDFLRIANFVNNNSLAYLTYSISGDDQGRSVAQGYHDNWYKAYNIVREALSRNDISENAKNEAIETIRSAVLASFHDSIEKVQSVIATTHDPTQQAMARTILDKLRNFQNRVQTMPPQEFLKEFLEYNDVNVKYAEALQSMKGRGNK